MGSWVKFQPLIQDGSEITRLRPQVFTINLHFSRVQYQRQQQPHNSLYEKTLRIVFKLNLELSGWEPPILGCVAGGKKPDNQNFSRPETSNLIPANSKICAKCSKQKGPTDWSE
eukprot:4560040-Amphidinium_carterae.1